MNSKFSIILYRLLLLLYCNKLSRSQVGFVMAIAVKQ